jgi:hypothetical protein
MMRIAQKDMPVAQIVMSRVQKEITSAQRMMAVARWVIRRWSYELKCYLVIYQVKFWCLLL